MSNDGGGGGSSHLGSLASMRADPSNLSESLSEVTRATAAGSDDASAVARPRAPVADFKFRFSRRSRVFVSGEDVKGWVVVSPRTRRGVHSIRLELNGEVAQGPNTLMELLTGGTSHVAGGAGGKGGGGGQRRGRRGHRLRPPPPLITEQFFTDKRKVVEEATTLEPGRRIKHKFNFKLPRDAPSSSCSPAGFDNYQYVPDSIKGERYCVVRWFVVAVVELTDEDDDAAAAAAASASSDEDGGSPPQPCGRSQEPEVLLSDLQFVHVNRLCDLNRVGPPGRAPFSRTEESGDLRLEVKVPRTKVVCGDELAVDVKAANGGRGFAKLAFKLHSIVSGLNADSLWATAAGEFELAENVKAGGRRTVRKRMAVPIVPPTDSGGTVGGDSTRVKHWLVITAQVEGCPEWCCSVCAHSSYCRTTAAKFVIPIVVGNIPLEDEMKSYERLDSKELQGFWPDLVKTYPMLPKIVDVKSTDRITPRLFFHRPGVRDVGWTRDEDDAEEEIQEVDSEGEQPNSYVDLD